jgi:hypothetical protein
MFYLVNFQCFNFGIQLLPSHQCFIAATIGYPAMLHSCEETHSLVTHTSLFQVDDGVSWERAVAARDAMREELKGMGATDDRIKKVRKGALQGCQRLCGGSGRSLSQSQLHESQ